jgi:hypothetical protein
MLTLLLLSTLPHAPDTLTDRVDRIELNHVQCDQTGEPKLHQVIYWRWNAEHSRYNVTAWRMVDKRPSLIRRHGRGWIETREDGVIRREIHAEQFVETWTFDDPEITDRDQVSPEMRRGLRLPLSWPSP